MGFPSMPRSHLRPSEKRARLMVSVQLTPNWIIRDFWYVKRVDDRHKLRCLVVALQLSDGQLDALLGDTLRLVAVCTSSV
jgi:hypothetical protein